MCVCVGGGGLNVKCNILSNIYMEQKWTKHYTVRFRWDQLTKRRSITFFVVVVGMFFVVFFFRKTFDLDFTSS